MITKWTRSSKKVSLLVLMLRSNYAFPITDACMYMGAIYVSLLVDLFELCWPQIRAEVSRKGGYL